MRADPRSRTTRPHGGGERSPSGPSPGPGARAAVATLLVASLAAASCAPEGGAGRFLSIGTGGTGGIYYPLGGALAGRLSVRDSVRQFTAEVTGGSVENVNRVREGQIDLGFSLALTAYEAHRGGQDYERPVEGLRVVAPLYPNVIHVLVPGGSGAGSLADRAGARVSVGSAGSGTEQTSQQLLEAYGITYDEIEVQYLSFSESSAALRDGALDAAILSVGYPAAAVLEATTTGDVRLLPVDGEGRRTLLERYPYYSEGEIPTGVYPGVERAIPTVAMLNWIVGMESLDPSVVTGVLNTLREDREELVRVHDMARQIDLSVLEDAPIPLHPAARRWIEADTGAASGSLP